MSLRLELTQAAKPTTPTNITGSFTLPIPTCPPFSNHATHVCMPCVDMSPPASPLPKPCHTCVCRVLSVGARGAQPSHQPDVAGGRQPAQVAHVPHAPRQLGRGGAHAAGHRLGLGRRGGRQTGTTHTTKHTGLSTPSHRTTSHPLNGLPLLPFSCA